MFHFYVVSWRAKPDQTPSCLRGGLTSRSSTPHILGDGEGHYEWIKGTGVGYRTRNDPLAILMATTLEEEFRGEKTHLSIPFS